MTIMFIKPVLHVNIHATLVQMEVNALVARLQQIIEPLIQAIFVNVSIASMMMGTIINFACRVFTHV